MTFAKNPVSKACELAPRDQERWTKGPNWDANSNGALIQLFSRSLSQLGTGTSFAWTEMEAMVELGLALMTE